MKTPQEAAREYAKRIWRNGREYQSPERYSIEDFLFGASWVERWFGVEKELPEYRVDVCLITEFGHIFRARHDEYGWWIFDGFEVEPGIGSSYTLLDEEIYGKPTHFRPIERVKE